MTRDQLLARLLDARVRRDHYSRVFGDEAPLTQAADVEVCGLAILFKTISAQPDKSWGDRILLQCDWEDRVASARQPI